MKAKEIKRREGEVRNAAWSSLTKDQKVAKLDQRLGKGIGAARQRAKLN